MAATAQDPSAPLRGPEKKDEDRDEDSESCEDHHTSKLFAFCWSYGSATACNGCAAAFDIMLHW